MNDDSSAHGRVGLGLRILGEGIDAYLTGLYGPNWLDRLAARDRERGINKSSYTRADPHCGLRMLTEPILGVVELPREQHALAWTVRKNRDKWAHFQPPFSTYAADTALVEIAQLLDELGETDYRDRVSQLRGNWTAATAATPDPRQPTDGSFLSPWERNLLDDMIRSGHSAEQRSTALTGVRLGQLLKRKQQQRQQAAHEQIGALRRAADSGDAQAMKILADLLRGRGELPEAEHWYGRAGSLGDIAAGGHLGSMLMRRGDLREAEKWLLWAATGGNPYAMKDLATVLWRRGDREGAQPWARAYTRAMIGLNGGDAPFIPELRDKVDQGLDKVLDNLGDSRAGRFLRKTRDKYVPHATGHATANATPTSPQRRPEPNSGTSDDLGDPRSGGDQTRQPWQIEFERAENALRPAAESGDADAMVALGRLLERPELRPSYNGTWESSDYEQRKRDRQAKELYRTAIDNERHPGAMAALGALHHALGEYEEAKRRYIEAISAGDPSARTWLGELLLREQDGRAEGEQLLRESAELGDSKAKAALGILALERDQTREASKWLRDAADAGDAYGMLGLAAILRDDVNDTQAAGLCRSAIESAQDIPGRDRVNLMRSAMHGLGDILRSQGNLEEAESWIFWAAVLGDLDAMVALADILQARGAVAEAQRWLANPRLHGTAVRFESTGEAV